MARRAGSNAVGTLEAGVAGHRLQAGGDEIGAGVDRKHTGHRARRLDVDGDDVRMGIRRTLERDGRLSGDDEVVDEPAPAREQRRVLDPGHRTAAAESCRCVGCSHVVLMSC